MVDIQTIALVLTGLIITASIIYYASNLRNANKTRRAQIAMSFYSHVTNKEFWGHTHGSDNNPEFASTRYATWGTYNDLGYLVKHGFIDIEDVYILVGTAPLWVWNKYESVIYEQRKRYNGADWHSHFEELAKSLLKLKKVRDPSYEVPTQLARYISSN